MAIRFDPGGTHLETAAEGAARHLAKIHEADGAGAAQARCSTTEAIMVALALCNRAYLPGGLQGTHAGHLWWRLDDAQRAAIQVFAAQAAAGGKAASSERRA